MDVSRCPSHRRRAPAIVAPAMAAYSAGSVEGEVTLRRPSHRPSHGCSPAASPPPPTSLQLRLRRLLPCRVANRLSGSIAATRLNKGSRVVRDLVVCLANGQNQLNVINARGYQQNRVCALCHRVTPRVE
jgi:hypothetical protein